MSDVGTKTLWKHSYDFDSFSDKERCEELRRLSHQAEFARAIEEVELKRIGLAPGMQALEIGCGPGFLTGIISEICAPGEAHGLDFSRELLDAAEKLVKPKHPNLKFFQGSAYATGLADASYDFVYNRMLYQHLAKPLDALKEARRITRPGGRVVVVDVDAGWQMMEPHCPEFDQLNELACQAQEKIGGDRFIGRKLPNMFREADFRDVGLRIISLSSVDVDMKSFLDITTRFKAMQIATEEGFALMRKVDAFCAALKRPPLIVVGVFFGVGTV